MTIIRDVASPSERRDKRLVWSQDEKRNLEPELLALLDHLAEELAAEYLRLLTPNPEVRHEDARSNREVKR